MSKWHPRIMSVHVLQCLPFYCCRCTNGTVKIPPCTVISRLSPVELAGLVSSWGAFVIQWTYSSVIQVVWRRKRQLKLSATLISWQLYWSNLKFFITKVGLSKWKLLRQVCTMHCGCYALVTFVVQLAAQKVDTGCKYAGYYDFYSTL